MNWDKIDLHVENLIPGLALLLFLYKHVTFREPPLPEEAMVAVALTAAAYLLGALVNVFSRLSLDSISKWTARPLMIWAFGKIDKNLPLLGEKYEGKFCEKIDAINRAYSKAIDAGLSCGKPRIVSEVAKRRQTGRMVRSALLPLVICGCYVVWWPYATATGIVVILVLYGYSEAVIFLEGCRGMRVKEERLNSKSQIANQKPKIP